MFSQGNRTHTHGKKEYPHVACKHMLLKANIQHQDFFLAPRNEFSQAWKSGLCSKATVYSGRYVLYAAKFTYIEQLKCVNRDTL